MLPGGFLSPLKFLKCFPVLLFFLEEKILNMSNGYWFSTNHGRFVFIQRLI